MVEIPAKSDAAPFFPESWRDALAGLVYRLIGVALIMGGLALAVCLLSFHADDPSWNHIHDGPVRNLTGSMGANIADLMMQWLGFAGLLVAAAGLSWGFRWLRAESLPARWLAPVSLPPALLLTAALLAALPLADSWRLQSGAGGLIGDRLLYGLDLIWQWLPAGGGRLASILLLVLLVVPTVATALAIRPREWRSGSGIMWRSLRWLTAQCLSFGRRLWGLRLGRMISVRREPGFDYNEADAEDAAIGYPPKPADGDEDEEADLSKPKTQRRKISVSRAKKTSAPKAKPAQQAQFLFPENDNYRHPPLALLQAPSRESQSSLVTEEELAETARRLEAVLSDYGIRGSILKVRPGPVVTLYELEPAPGTKTNRVVSLSDDIARSMSALSVRVATVPGRSVIGIELPNPVRESVLLRALLAAAAKGEQNQALPLALGKDIGGTPVVADLSRMPHLLIAGTTGSGKSVSINTMILSLLYRLRPEHCRLILIDPKMLELSVYDDIPHLLTPVVTDPAKAVVALKWTVREMEERYHAMARLGVRSITNYNARLQEALDNDEQLTRTVQVGFDPDSKKPIFEEQPLDLTPMPYIVVVVDEMADLMMVAGKEIEGAIQRLAQMARAAGIHLIMATQRPSVDVITGTIKANFPTRISFQVTSKIDSRTILGEQGAEQLLGQGDMLYMAGGGRVQRVHGPFVSDQEVERVVNHLKKQGMPEYLDEVLEASEEDEAALPGSGNSTGDDLYDRAIDIVSRNQRASTSFLQRHLQIGYNRAALLIERMEADNVIGPADHVGKREIYVRKPDADF